MKMALPKNQIGFTLNLIMKLIKEVSPMIVPNKIALLPIEADNISDQTLKQTVQNRVWGLKALDYTRKN